MADLPILSAKNHAKKTAPIKIMQFGEGNFLRAFVCWLIQKMNDSGKYEGHVVVVQPLPMGRVDALAAQDGLYTLILQGINEQGKAVREAEVIDVIDDVVNPYQDYAKYLKYAESKDLEVIVSNTTEAGICFDEKDVGIDLEKDTPNSYPGKVLALLKHRYDVLGPKAGLALIPCELIDDNGDHLKEVLNQLAKARHMDQAFIDYLNNECHYTSTLVDRIVPGFPRDEFGDLCKAYGYVDNNMVKGEYFHLYVLREEPYVMEKFPVHSVGLHAIYVPDAHPLFHSDRGFQYTNRGFFSKLEAAGMTQSMSRVAKCIDNGPMEGFLGILKRERYYGKRFTDRESLVKMIEEYIVYYNTRRLQRNLGVMTPLEKHGQYKPAA